MNGPFSINVNKLTKRFGEFTAVDRVSFHTEKGEIFGYLGANGAGKSTTIKMLCGLLTPSEGKAEVAGMDVAVRSVELKRKIGYMSQKFSLYMDLRIEENLEFFGGAFGIWGKSLRNRSEYLLERVGLLEHKQMLTGQMPGGWRQKLALACAMLHKPQILFLDEPTSGVDPSSRRNFWHLIKEVAEDGTTVFVTTHYMDEAEYCDRVGLMVAGRLPALDTPSNLKTTWVPGRMYRVYNAKKSRIQVLEKVGGVFEVTSFGTGYKIRISKDGPRSEDIRNILEADNSQGVEIEQVQPTLEDVFLKVISSAQKKLVPVVDK